MSQLNSTVFLELIRLLAELYSTCTGNQHYRQFWQMLRTDVPARISFHVTFYNQFVQLISISSFSKKMMKLLFDANKIHYVIPVQIDVIQNGEMLKYLFLIC